MQCYLVHMPDGKETVEEKFPNHHHLIADDVWAVASPLMTSSEVCSLLGIEGGRSMVVVPMRDYYGRSDRALWQKLKAWGEQ